MSATVNILSSLNLQPFLCVIVGELLDVDGIVLGDEVMIMLEESDSNSKHTILILLAI